MSASKSSLVLSSISFLLIGTLLGSFLSHAIHYVTIRCITCDQDDSQEDGLASKIQSLTDSKSRQDRDVPDVDECGEIKARLTDLQQLTVGGGVAQLLPAANSDLPSTRDSVEEYLNPSNPVGSTKQVELGSVLLKEEYRPRKVLYVGVMTAQEYISTRAVAVYGTWGIEVDKVGFYVGEDCKVPQYQSVLPIVKLDGVPDKVYPPQRKVFRMLRYMHDHYINEYDWFLRADDDVYMRGGELRSLLMRLNPSEKIYFGRSGSGKPEDIRRLKLLPHERYCMGGPGVVFSNAALRALVPHLDDCLEAIEYYNKFTESPWYNEDVELGRCVSRKVGIQCSGSSEIRSLLLYDYDSLALNPNTLWSSSKLRQAISIHPVKNPDNMHAVHHFYKTLDMQKLQNEKRLAQMTSVQTCQQLPQNLRNDNPTCKPPPSSCEQLPDPVCQMVPRSSLPPIYRPQNLEEIPIWLHFDYRYIHQVDMNVPRLLLGGEMAKDVEAVTRQAVQILVKRGREVNFERVVNGFVRYDGLRRREYIVDMLFSTYNSTRMLTKRLSIVQPLTGKYQIQPQGSRDGERLFLVVPLFNVQSRFSAFMVKYENTVLKIRQNLQLLHLWLVVFGSDDVEHIREVLESYQQKYPTAQFTIIEGKGGFARGLAIHQGISVLKDSSLIFICDVDLDIHPDFFQRCAKNTIKGKRVYYPMFFKLYNEKYISDNVTEPPVVEMTRKQGHWASYSYGMLCIYKSDYVASGGFNTGIQGWGGEDVDLYEKVIKAGIEVLRTPDPGLVHRWHPKRCRSDLDKTQYTDCMYSKAENFADREELSIFVKKLEKQVFLAEKSSA